MSGSEEPSARHADEGEEQRDTGRSDRRENRGGGTSPLEWVVAALSILLVLGAVGIMLYEAITEPETPPLIEVTVEDISTAAGGYLVQFRAHNLGQTTAAGLIIEGELRKGKETVETASITIDYVPSEGERRAGLFFSHDPDSFVLEVKPKGYDLP